MSDNETIIALKTMTTILLLLASAYLYVVGRHVFRPTTRLDQIEARLAQIEAGTKIVPDQPEQQKS